MEAADKPKATLADLPPEIIRQIASHAPTARYLRDLSLTCRSICRAVQTNGWAGFVTHRFPSIETPPYWRDAAQALTTLSKNFDTKSIIVEDIGPSLKGNHVALRQLPSGRISRQWQRPGKQTMGYQPVLDSREEWFGSWDSRKEVVVWGAGADVVARVVERSGSAQKQFTPTSDEERSSSLAFDQSGNTSRYWLTYRGVNDLEGLDDVTSINLLNSGALKQINSSEEAQGSAVDLIAGRASKNLQLLRLWLSGARCLRTFDTSGSTVRAADVSHTNHPLLGACLGDAKVGLFHVDGKQGTTTPISESKCVSNANDKSRSWSARFLCPDKFAVGRGISHRIVYVYSVRPEGLSKEPIRAFGGKSGDEDEIKTSAYPIISVPESWTCGDGFGTTFFSGGHDGLIRLHDMRAPQDCVGLISDLIERSAIFSLATVGRERLIAGSSRHKFLKIFDLRMTGGRTYSYTAALGQNKDQLQQQELNPLSRPVWEENGLASSGWGVFMAVSNPIGTGHKRPVPDSPIYSLSRPSASSPCLYVGMENTVAQVNFTDPDDKHPDPVFNKSIVRLADGTVNARKSYGSVGTQLVTMYTYTEEGGETSLRQFQPLASHQLYRVVGYSSSGNNRRFRG